MDFSIITDSCADLTLELKRELGATTVPLTLRLGDKEFLDDDSLDLPGFMEEMAACTGKVGSACPPPAVYHEAYKKAGKAFVVTLSSQLSGSYDSAMAGKQLADEAGDAEVHVFDSKSATAGEVLLALKVKEAIDQNTTKKGVIDTINQFIARMNTYCILENYDNLQKNGRLNKVAGKIIGLFGVRLVMGTDREGNIELRHKVRGENSMLDKMVSLVEESGRDTDGEQMVISHCYNPGLAERLAAAVKSRFNFGRIHIVPTGGLSSLYADNKDVVMAF